jgi:hypothetical protein
VDLSPYCKAIVASDQPLAFYQAISTNRAWFEAWINAGGILEFHGATRIGDDWSGQLQPGNYDMTFYLAEAVSINEPGLTLFNRPNPITDAELDNWEISLHGYFENIPAGSSELVSHDAEQQPAAMKFDMGQGCVLATLQTLEWAWDREYSPLLENFLSYDNCQANYQLYLSISFKNGP